MGKTDYQAFIEAHTLCQETLKALKRVERIADKSGEPLDRVGSTMIHLENAINELASVIEDAKA